MTTMHAMQLATISASDCGGSDGDVCSRTTPAENDASIGMTAKRILPTQCNAATLRWGDARDYWPFGRCARPRRFSGSARRIEHELRTAEQRDGLLIGFACDDGVPDLRRGAQVHGTRGSRDRAFQRRADEVALELDRRESVRLVGKMHHAAIAASGVRECDHRCSMQIPVRRKEIGTNVELGVDAAFAKRDNAKADQSGQLAGPPLVQQFKRDAFAQCHRSSVVQARDAIACVMCAAKRSTNSAGVSQAHMKRTPVAPTKL